MVITDKMIEAGKEIASLLVDATCQKSFGELGGCKKFNIDNYPKKYRNLIIKYINAEIESVTAIYISMENENTRV